jgi:NAD(P)H dehydrogenase (quinone)
MTIAVFGATGKVGQLVARELLERGETVNAYVRNSDKARKCLGTAGALSINQMPLDDLGAVSAAIRGASTIFVSMGSIGIEGNIQRTVLEAARRSTALRQLVRLSVLNASTSSLGINQRAHQTIDFAATLADIPYTTIQPAIFSASLFAAAEEICAHDTWTGLADTGKVALIDHRDVANVAVHILANSTAWGAHYQLTGPTLMDWPQAMALLSAELKRTIRFIKIPDRELLNRMLAAGVPPGFAELLITREWAIEAGENERITNTVTNLTGQIPRTVEAFLHANRSAFLS